MEHVFLQLDVSRSCLKLLNLNGTGADTVSHFSGSLLRASTLSYRRLCHFFLVEISGFFRADINIFNSLLAKQPLKSQAVAFPSCFVELEHIFFGDQVFMEALKFESLLLQIVKGNLRWCGLVDQLFKLFNPPVFIVQQRLYSCQGK